MRVAEFDTYLITEPLEDVSPIPVVISRGAISNSAQVLICERPMCIFFHSRPGVPTDGRPIGQAFRERRGLGPAVSTAFFGEDRAAHRRYPRQ